jgi:hypothetical protein
MSVQLSDELSLSVKEKLFGVQNTPAKQPIGLARERRGLGGICLDLQGFSQRC